MTFPSDGPGFHRRGRAPWHLFVLVGSVIFLALPSPVGIAGFRVGGTPPARSTYALPAPTPLAAPQTHVAPSVSTSSTAWQTLYTLYVSNNTLRPGNRIVPNLGRPYYIVFDPKTDRLYASIDCTIYVIDPSVFQIVGRLHAAFGCGVIYLPSTGDLYLSSSGNISIVDPLNDTLVGRIAAPQAGQTVQGLFVYDEQANAIIVGNQFSSTANVVGLTQGRILANLSVGYNTMDGAYDPVNGKAYIGCYENSTLATVNSTTWAVTYTAITFGLFLLGVGVDTRTGDVYATTYFYSTGLTRVSGSTGAVLNTTGLGSYPSGIAFDNATNVLYVADSEASQIHVVNPTNLSVIGTISVHAPAFGIYGQWWPDYVPELQTLYVPTSWQSSLVAIAASNNTVYGNIGGITEPGAALWDPACGCLVVGDFLTYNLDFINATTFQVFRTVHLSGAVRAMTYDNTTGELWVGMGSLFGGSGLDVLYGSNGTLITTIGSGRLFNAPAFDPVDDRMFVADLLGSTVNVYNATNFSLVAQVTDQYQTNAAWDPLNDRVYVSDWEANNVTVINGSNDSIVTTIRHVPGPNAIVYDAATNRIVTGDENAAKLTVIDPSNNSIESNLSFPSYAARLLPQPGSDRLVVSSDTGVLSFLNLSNDTSFNVSAGSQTDGLAWLPSTGALAAADLGGAVYVVANTTQNLLTSPAVSVNPEVIDQGSTVVVAANATGGTTPYSYSYTVLPAGCASANSSRLNCTPSSPGMYRVTVVVTDSAGHSTSGWAAFWVDETFDVSFTESGLPTGTSWWVNLSDRQSFMATGPTLSFLQPNGSLSYSVHTGGTTWIATVNAGGRFTVAGAPVAVAVTFTEAQVVTFQESGLLPGTPWRVTIGAGLVYASSGSQIVVGELPGSYAYTATVPAGGYGSVTGSVRVAGQPVTVPVNFTTFEFQASFVAQGLPAGTTWWLNLSTGASTESAASVVAFQVPNGTFRYLAETAGRMWGSLGGQLSITGYSKATVLNFVLETYGIRFAAHNLPSGHPFWVNLSNGASLAATGSSAGVSQPNGSYPYTASAGSGWVDIHGTATVRGAATTVDLNFARVVREVTFAAVALEAGGSWWVNVSGGELGPSTAGHLTTNASDGVTIPYTVGGPPNQIPEVTKGSIPAGSSNVTVSIPFPSPVAVVSFTAVPVTVPVGGTTNLSVVATGGEGSLNYTYSGSDGAGCSGANLPWVLCHPALPGTYTVNVRIVDSEGSFVVGSVQFTATSAAATTSGAVSSVGWTVIALVVVVATAALGALLVLRRRRGGAASSAGPADSAIDPEAEAPPESNSPGADPEPTVESSTAIDGDPGTFS